MQRKAGQEHERRESGKIAVEGWPESEARNRYLKDLRRLRDAMVRSKVGFAGGAILGRLKNRYPEAHDVFKKELEDL